MDGTEDSSYLTLLNDGTHNYLLQTSEETLNLEDPNLNVGPMFTEIDSGETWSVLMNADQEMDLPTQSERFVLNSVTESAVDISGSLTELYDNSVQTKENSSLEKSVNEEDQIVYPIEIPGKGYLTTDGLYIANDLLFQLKLNLDDATENQKTKSIGQDILINPKTLTLANDKPIVKNCETDKTKKEPSLDSELVNSNTTIQPSNDTISNIDNSPFNNKHKNKMYNSIYSHSDIFEMVTAHKCKQCSFLCEERNEMMRHWEDVHIKELDEKNGLKFAFNGELKMRSILKNSAQQIVYVCSVCNFGFASTEKLRNHMINAHKLMHWPLDLASLKEVQPVTENGTKNSGTKQKLTLADIQKQAKASKKIKCSVKGCDLRFTIDDMRMRHEKCHVDGQKKQFKCFECDSKFPLWRVCSMHLWKCHKVDLGLFTCPMCSVFKVSTPRRLFNHMAIHEDEKPFLCNNCGKTFKQLSQLRNHQIIHKQTEDVPEWAAQQQCDICKKFFANSKCLKKHIQSVHHKFKPFICNICGHKTTRKAMLELHLRQHTGEKPHKCPICEYKTGDHNSLRRHVMRHSGDTKYACPHCNYQSIQSTSYKNHIASKHPGLGGSYFCSLCSYHTVNENTYNSHLVDHKNGLIGENKDTAINKEKPKLNGNYKQKVTKEPDDDETQNYLLLLDHSNDAVDTGGITIPAGVEL